MAEYLSPGLTLGPSTAPFDPNTGFVHPAYAGTDPAYLAWLSGADLRSTDATTKAKRKRGEADTAYQQALADLATEATNSRRNLQTNMLSRGMFNSGETNRRAGELDSAFDQAKLKAGGVYQTNLGSIDDEQQSAIAGLGSEGANQVSQAMLRDSLAAYNAQQQAAQSAPQAQAQAQAQPQAQYVPPSTYSAKPKPGAPVINSSASLYASQSKPKKPASGSTGGLKQVKSGLQ